MNVYRKYEFANYLRNQIRYERTGLRQLLSRVSTPPLPLVITEKQVNARTPIKQRYFLVSSLVPQELRIENALADGRASQRETASPR